MKNINNEGSNESYFSEPALPFKVEEKKLTVNDAVNLIFEILNVKEPTKEQRSFTKTEVLTAKKNRSFKKLIIVLSGLMDKIEQYWATRYIFID